MVYGDNQANGLSVELNMENEQYLLNKSKLGEKSQKEKLRRNKHE